MDSGLHTPNLQFKTSELEVFVLAGGKSSRMGTDKGLVTVGPLTLIEHTLFEVNRLHIPIRIVAHHPAYAKFGFPVYADCIPGMGPMGGLFTALSYAKLSRILLLSCDTLHLKAEYLALLTEQFGTAKIIVASYQKRLMPLCGIYEVDLKYKVQAYIREGRLKMQDFIKSQYHRVIPIDDLVNQFGIAPANCNTPDEVHKATQYLCSSTRKI